MIPALVFMASFLASQALYLYINCHLQHYCLLPYKILSAFKSSIKSITGLSITY